MIGDREASVTLCLSHLPGKQGVKGSVPGFCSPPNETINLDPMTIFQDKLLTRTYCDEIGDFDVPNMLSPRDLVFRPDYITYQLRDRSLLHLNVHVCSVFSTDLLSLGNWQELGTNIFFVHL